MLLLIVPCPLRACVKRLWALPLAGPPWHYCLREAFGWMHLENLDILKVWNFTDPGKVCQSHDLVYRTRTDDPRYHSIVTGEFRRFRGSGSFCQPSRLSASPAAPALAMAPSDLLRKTLIPFWWNCFPVQDLPQHLLHRAWLGRKFGLIWGSIPLYFLLTKFENFTWT